MSGMIFMKVLGDICLCYAVVGAFPLLFPHDFLLLIPALLGAGGVGLAAALDARNQRWTKFASAALPLASFMLMRDMMDLLILLPGVVYSLAAIFREEYGLEYYDFRAHYQLLLKFLGTFAGAVFALGYFEGMYTDSWSTYDVTAVLMYGGIFTLLGVFLLRQLRLGEDSKASDRRMNNLQLIIVLCAVAGLTALIVLARDLIQDSVGFVLNLIISFVSVVPLIFHEVMRWFINLESDGYLEVIRPTDSTLPTGTELPPSVSGIPEQQVPELTGFPWWLAFLVIAGLCVAVFFMLRSSGVYSGGYGSRGRTETLDEDQSGLQMNASHASNRKKVRKTYREFLRYVKKQGQNLKTDQTSQDILLASKAHTAPKPSAQLRDLYLKARYGDNCRITRTDADRAKEALRSARRRS